MAEVPADSLWGHTEDDGEWQSSKIKGFTFEDDDETPFQEISKYQAQTLAANSIGGKEENELVISFDSAVGLAAGSSRVVTDRVRAATAAYAARLDRQERGLSISEAIGGESSQTVVSNDPKVLRAEIAQLKRQVEKIHAARFTPLHPKETVKNIFLGQPYSLELYKSFTDKVALIDEALELGDGNAILAVSLFLKQTLSRYKLNEIFATRPSAVNHLAAYLEKKKSFQELADLLTASGRYEESAIVCYQQVIQQQSNSGQIDDTVRKFKILLQQNFHRHPDANHLIEHVHLLERLSPVIAADAKNSEISSRQAQQPTVPKLTASSSVLEALLYLHYFHYGQPENLLTSPAGLKKVHKLSEKQFVWVATSARAARFQWKDCEDLVLTKGWLGGRKARGAIDVGQVVKLLHSHGATADVLQGFLALVEPIEEREILAKKLQVHSVVVDVYAINRDRLGLENYKAKLVPQSREWFYAENALSVSNTKWKN